MTKPPWSPCMLVRVDPGQKIIRLLFSPAPAKFNVDEYFVALAPTELDATEIDTRTKNTSFTFTNVKPATYSVLVYPKQGGAFECEVCKRTYIQIFKITKTNHTVFDVIGKHCNNTNLRFPEEFKSQEPTTKSISLPVIMMASLLFLVFFSIILCLAIKYRHIFISRKKSVLNDDSQPNPPEKDKMKLFVINTFDHEQHQKACESFMVYLHEHCFCEVLNLSENYMFTDLADILKSVNFILLIHSEGYSKQVNAWKEKIIYPELCKSNPSILLQVMNSSITNCIECALNYTNPNYLTPTNSCKELFIIPDHMTELVCYLHNINLDTTDEENIPLIKEHIYSSDDGLKMTNAIDRATEYELLHDDWFLRLHPYSFTV